MIWRPFRSVYGRMKKGIRGCNQTYWAHEKKRGKLDGFLTSARHYLSTLPSFHLKEFFSFVSFLFFLLSTDDHGSFVIWRSDSVRPKHLTDQNFDHDYFFKLPLTRERDAQSSGRRFTSRHVRFRAVPRANRTLRTANTHSHSATSNTTELPISAPWPPWRYSFPDASLDVGSDAASPGYTVSLLVLLPPARNAEARYLAC